VRTTDTAVGNGTRVGSGGRRRRVRTAGQPCRPVRPCDQPRPANPIREGSRHRYEIEDRARDVTAAARPVLRQPESMPILDRIETVLDERSKRILPQWLSGKGSTSARNPSAGCGGR